MQPFASGTDANRFLAVGEHVVDIDTLRLLTRPDGTAPDAEGRGRAAAAGARRRAARSAATSLLNDVWKGTCPTPDVLTQAVKDLRRALGDDLHAPRYVETLPRLGYRLVAPARFVDQLTTPASASAMRIRAGRARRSASIAHGSRLAQRVAMPHRWLTIAGCSRSARRAAQETQRRRSTPRWHGERAAFDHGRSRSREFPAHFAGRYARRVFDRRCRPHHAHIVQRSLTQSRVVRLTEPNAGDEFYPVWSPDGATIAFARYIGDQCKILIAPALGGAERARSILLQRVRSTIFRGRPTRKHLSRRRRRGRPEPIWPSRCCRSTAAQSRRFPYEHSAIRSRSRRALFAGRHADRISSRRKPVQRSVRRRRERRRGAPVDASGQPHARLRLDARRQRARVLVGTCRAAGALHRVDRRRRASMRSACSRPNFRAPRAHRTRVVYEIPRMRTQLATVALDGGEERAARPRAVDRQRRCADVLAGRRPARVRVRSQRIAAAVAHDPTSGETFPLTEATEPTLRYPVWRPDGARILMTARGASCGGLIEIDIATRTRRVLTLAGRGRALRRLRSKPDTLHRGRRRKRARDAS